MHGQQNIKISSILHIVERLRQGTTDESCLDFQQNQKILSFTGIRPALGPTQPYIK